MPVLTVGSTRRREAPAKDLDQYGLFCAATGAPVAPRARSEKEVAAQVGPTYRPPAARARA